MYHCLNRKLKIILIALKNFLIILKVSILCEYHLFVSYSIAWCIKPPNISTEVPLLNGKVMYFPIL